MKITKAGVYVMIKKYGIEGLMREDEHTSITIDSEREEAVINGQVTL